MNFRTLPWLIVTIPSIIAGCSAGTKKTDANGSSPNGNGDGASTNGDGTTAPGGTPADDVDLTGTSGTVDPNDTRDVPVREQTCDANGANCTCLNLALLGSLDSSAYDTDTGPFVDWLNANSGGTARATLVTTKPTLDAAFLSQYDILIIANVNGWTFSAEEKAAVAQWSAEGGGIISLTGFITVATEPAATSQLIEFAGLGYTSVETAKEGAAQSTPVYYDGGTVDLRNCLAWQDANGSTGASTPIITAAINFPEQTGQLAKLTFELDYVGAFRGYGVIAPADATVVATDPTSSQPMAVAKEVNGAGRVFAFGDEWVIFANQWEPRGQASNQQQDQYNICYNPELEETFHSVASLYQAKQFWYNAINWVAPPNECSFDFTDTDVEPWVG